MKSQSIKDVYPDIRDVFTYDDGELFWKVSPRYGRKEGSPASVVIATGYKAIRFRCRAFTTHRLIFLYHHGYIPEFIDHIDGDKLNNRIENLRPCTKSENAFNAKLRKATKSGVRGVSWSSKNKKWVARIKVRGMDYFLGCFDDLNEAAKVATEFRKANHKEFFR